MRLVATSGDQTLSFPLRQGSTLIGRHPTCHVCIPAKGLSRRHAQVFVDGTEAVLRDLRSSNGTFVNSRRIERTELSDGDVISLGGFTLRFDSEGAVPAGGAFPAAGGRGEDVVVTASPEADATQPVEPYPDEGPATERFPEEPPPAPTDFPEQPDGDETPVDGAFIPQPYAGGQSYMPTVQPQVVVRDGRWFLRDPRTGREVEIAPRGGAAAIPAAAEARRPNVRLLLAAVATAVVVVVLFAVFFLSQNGGTGTTGESFPIADYNRLVDAAIAGYREAQKLGGQERDEKLAKALERLDLANGKRSDIYTASLIAKYIRLRTDAGDDLSRLNWIEARKALDDVSFVFSASAEARAFAEKETHDIDREHDCIGMAQQALRKLGQGDSVELLLEVYNDLGQVPEDSWAYQHIAQPRREAIRKQIGQTHLTRARRAMDERKWDDAAKYLGEALPFADDPAAIRKEIASCQGYAREARLLADARAEFDQQNYDAAKVPLQDIQPDSPYAEEARTLLAQIDAAKARQAAEALRQQVLTLYKEGAGDEATKLVREHDLQELAYIPQRVERLTGLMAAGRKAEQAGDYEDALRDYQQAVEVEPDAENAYTRRAQGLLDDLKARFPQIAAELTDQAYRLREKDPTEARRLFERALTFDPEQPRARQGLDHLHRAAQDLYNIGLQHLGKSEYVQARGAFRKALARATPGSELHKAIERALARLP